MTVADNLAMAARIANVTMRLDPLGDFRFNGLTQQLLSAVAKNACQHVLGAYGWQRQDRIASLSHGGVLRGRMWLSRNQIQTQVRRLLQLNSSTTFGYSSNGPLLGLC